MREIVQYPDIVLLKKASAVAAINDYVKSVASDLEYYVNRLGVPGIAAPQVNEPIRLISFQFGIDVISLVNPEITKVSDQTIMSEEQCLSLENVKGILVKRWKFITVVGRLLDGRSKKFDSRDLVGRALQHEIDHLNGVLINTKG